MIYDRKFQSYIISAALKTHKGMAQLIPLLLPQYFDYSGDKHILKAAKLFFTEFRLIPDESILRQKIDSEYHPYLKKVLKRKVKDIDILITEVKKFVQIERVKKAYVDSALLVDDGKIKEASAIIRKALSGEVTGSGASGSMAFSQLNSNLNEITLQSTNSGVPTGFLHLDNLMNGGLFPGELGVVMAKLKLGKSFFLLNLAYAAASMLAGVNVVFYTLENSRWKTMRRLYRRVLRSTDVTLESSEQLHRRAKQMFVGDIYVQQFPTGGAGVSDLMSHMDYLIDNKGFNPKLVVVDYADCLRPERGIGEKRFELNAIFEDLRRLAGEFNVPVWTATQTRRVGFDKRVVQADDSSESIGKPQIADVFLTMSQAKEEAEQNKILLNLAAMRDSPGDRVVILQKDYSKSMLYSVGVNDVFEYDKTAEQVKGSGKKPSNKSVLKNGKTKF